MGYKIKFCDSFDNEQSKWFESIPKFVGKTYINNDLVIHKQVKISDIISRRFGDFMTPLSRVEMRLKLTMRVQELQLIYM